MLSSNQSSLLATIWLKHRVPPHYSQQLAILKVQLHLLIKFLSYITGRRCFYMIFVHCSSVRDGQTSISFPRKTLNSFFINIYCKSVCFYIPLKTIYYVCQTYIAMKRLQRPIPCCKFPSEDSILFDIFTLLQSFQKKLWKLCTIYWICSCILLHRSRRATLCRNPLETLYLFNIWAVLQHSRQAVIFNISLWKLCIFFHIRVHYRSVRD